MFGKLQGVYWISKDELSKQREAEIDSSFEAVVFFIIHKMNLILKEHLMS